MLSKIFNKATLILQNTYISAKVCMENKILEENGCKIRQIFKLMLLTCSVFLSFQFWSIANIAGNSSCPVDVSTSENKFKKCHL